MNQCDLNKIIYKNIKKYIQNAKNVYIKEEVIKELDINEKSFYKLKSIHNITINNIYKISRLLNVPINKFFEVNDD